MLDSKTLNELADHLLGTCKAVESALDYLDLEDEIGVEDAEDQLLDLNVERCPFCDWWMYSWELIDDQGHVVGCDQCR